MVNDEVEIMGQKDEYEVVPLTPIRRLEKRMEKMETGKSMTNLERLMDKILDMVELNQRIVDEMVKSNQSLREDLYSLVGKIDSLQKKMGNFIDIVSDAGRDETGGSGMKEGMETLVKTIVESNKAIAEGNLSIVEGLGSIEERLKKLQLSSGPARPTTLYRPRMTGLPRREGAQK